MTRPALCLLALSILPACASTGNEMDQTVEDAVAARKAAEEAALLEQDRFDKTLLNLDKTLDKYVEAVTRSGFQRYDQQAAGIEKYLRATVAKHFDQLLIAADSPAVAANQAIAVAALGFSERPEALDPMLNGLRSADSVVVNNAVFGLGVLQDSRTPPRMIARVLHDPDAPARSRIVAAWSLFQLQEAMPQPEQVYPEWIRILETPLEQTDPWILVQSLRGISRSREASYAPLAEKFAGHPAPLVRSAAAICLGYLGNRDSHTVLLTRIGPEETNPNVRLAARKALQALAGNIDRGYDVKEWRRVFETQREG